MSGESDSEQKSRNWRVIQTESAYRDAVQTLAMTFQSIEAMLRMCVGAAYALIAIRTLDLLDFKLDRNSLEKELQRDALGTLVRKYSRYFDAENLAKELGRLTPVRNHIAHTALNLYASAEPYDVHYMDRERTRIQTCQQEVTACAKLLSEHSRRLTDTLRAELDKLEQAKRRQLDLL
jgi:hypothetical protein